MSKQRAAEVFLHLIHQEPGWRIYRICRRSAPRAVDRWLLTEDLAQRALGKWVVGIGGAIYNDRPLRRRGGEGQDWGEDPRPYLFATQEAAEEALALYLLQQGG